MNADYRVSQEIAEILSKFCFSFNNLRLGTILCLKVQNDKFKIMVHKYSHC